MNNQNFLQNRPDEEGLMVLIELKALSDYTQKISSMLDVETQLPSWIQSKIAVAKSSLDEVYHFLDGLNTFKNMTSQSTDSYGGEYTPSTTNSNEIPQLVDFDEFVQSDNQEQSTEQPAEQSMELKDFDEVVGSGEETETEDTDLDYESEEDETEESEEEED
jgi:hypothetical protein